ncbi:MAG TPA: PH domain-containing protein [Streptosporangiaceae bacterium]|nr:PH domain-containing protein [Streptosporangiaceae bacterium]
MAGWTAGPADGIEIPLAVPVGAAGVAGVAGAAGAAGELGGTDRRPAVPFGQACQPADSSVGWLRLSPRSLIVRPLTDLARLLPLLAGLLILHSRTGSGLIWGIAASVLAVVTGLVHWATTRYRITDERVYVRRGLLNQKILSVARDRIRTVDVTAHLLHRMLGVCRVSIGTGRNDLRPGESFHLDGLTRSAAESLRDLLLAGSAAVGRSGAPAAAGGDAGVAAAGAAGAAGTAGEIPTMAYSVDGIDLTGLTGGPGLAGVAGAGVLASEPDRSADIVRLRAGWLRFAPLTMTGLVVLGVLIGSVLQISRETDINLATVDPVRLIVADFSALSLAQRILAGAAAALVGYVLVATAGYVAVFWKFRLVRQGSDTLRVTRGLLSTRATTISLSRLRGVEISEPLLLRAARGARCIAITTGLHVGRGAEREGSVLLPPAPRAVARAVAADVLGVSDHVCAGSLERHGPVARRRRFTRALAGAAVIVAAVAAATRFGHGPPWIWLSSLGLLPAAALLAADRYRSLGHRLADGWLVTRIGSLTRRRSIIGTEAIIGWRIHQSWFQRRQGLVTLTATTAAGRQHYAVQDVPVAQALAVATAATGDLVRPFLLPAAD